MKTEEKEFIPVVYRQNIRQRQAKNGFIKPIWDQIFMCVCHVTAYELYDSDKQLVRTFTPEHAKNMKKRNLIIEVTTTL